MYHVTTVERDDDGNLFCFHQISCSQLSEAARFINHRQQAPGMTLIRIVIESEREGGPRPIGEVTFPAMRLVHYSDKPVGELRIIPQSKGDEAHDNYFKPRGLWVSDDACEDNWRTWCESEGFSADRLTCPHDVALRPNANVLVLRSAADIDAFTAEYFIEPYPEMRFRTRMWIDWNKVRERYQGMIITPYIWERRLSMGDTPDAMWYYSWDCASGCIWDPQAIASITPQDLRPIGEVVQPLVERITK